MVGWLTLTQSWNEQLVSKSDVKMPKVLTVEIQIAHPAPRTMRLTKGTAPAVINCRIRLTIFLVVSHMSLFVTPFLVLLLPSLISAWSRTWVVVRLLSLCGVSRNGIRWHHQSPPLKGTDNGSRRCGTGWK